MRTKIKRFVSVLILAAFAIVFINGTTVDVDNNRDLWSKHLKFSVIATGADTCGPIDISGTKNWSLGVDFSKIVTNDTFMVDSGVTINLRQSQTRNKADMKTPSTADSSLSLFGGTDITTRGHGGSKGLTLDAMRYLWVIVGRADTRDDTLDLTDSTVITFNAVRDNK